MRYVHFLIGLLLSYTMLSPAIAATHSEWSIEGTIDASSYAGNARKSWLTEETMGKHRVGDGDNSVVVQGAFALRYDLNLQSGFQVETAYYPDPDGRFGVTQAFGHFKPLASGLLRSRYRVGAFHLPVSLENPGELWQSRYTATPSMLNTWVGEELRIIGAQGRWSWRPSRSSPHKLSLTAAGFGANDTAGAMLAWRGWAAHDRQGLLGETIGMPALPAIQPSAPFKRQAPEFEPFVEIDSRVGYFVGADWDYNKKIKLQYLYYDNRGDPLAFENGQYTWDTRFHHIGLKAKLADNWVLVGQFMTGNTVMGPEVVDNDFMSAFLLLSRKVNSHRFTARVEIFKVSDRDFLRVIDPNNENGHRVTLGYTFKINEGWAVSTEISQLQSDRDYRALFGERQKIKENQGLLQIKYHF